MAKAPQAPDSLAPDPSSPDGPGGAAPSLLGLTVDRYRVEELIGSGGMGEVYRAWDTTLERAVALKRLYPDPAGNEETRERALREARAASALGHPAIATIHDVLEYRHEILIVLELVAGTPLPAGTGEPMPLGTFLDIAAACASALAAARAAGVVHCDLKPGNILVTASGQVKILDFGISRRVRPGEPPSAVTTTPVAIEGTPAYMAPEALAGGAPTAASDIFSLGVIWHELLTGRHPFLRESTSGTVLAIMQDDPPAPGTTNPHVPAELDRLIARMLAKRPADRLSHPRELEEAIERIRSGPSAPRGTRGTRAGLHLTVRPFESRAVDATTAYFAAGLTEAVRVRLAGIDGIHVLDADAPVVGSLALEGSVQRSRKRLRIRYRLLDQAGGETLGGDMVEGDMHELFELEDRVTDGTGRLLAGKFGLAPPVERQLRPTADVTAYDLYLQARGYLARYEKEENIEIAIRLFRSALAEDPGFALALAGLAAACWKRYEVSRDPEAAREAESVALRALAAGPGLAEVRVTLGTVYFGTGRTEEAAREFRQAIELDPRSDEACRGLARAEEAAGRLDAAEETYLRAIRTRPDYWAGHNDLGVFHFRHGRYEDAVRDFSRVVELTPDNARGFSNLGAAYQTLGRTDEAIESYEHSLRLRPNHRAYSNLAILYQFRGRLEEAAATFARALEINPSDYRVWGSLAATYDLLGGREAEKAEALRRATELAERELRVNPGDHLLAAILAQFLGEVGRLDEARDLAGRVRAAGTRNAEVLYNLIFAYEGVGDEEAAFTMVREAVLAGYPVEKLRSDPATASLAADPRFEQAIAGAAGKGG